MSPRTLAPLIALILALAGAAGVHAAGKSEGRGPVSMHVSVGYDGQYSSGAWTPVHVVLQNRTTSDIHGAVEVPDNNSGSNYGPPQQYRSIYETSVVLPAGAKKRVALFLPLGSINGQVEIRFRSGGRVLAKHMSWPQAFDASTIVIGTLTDDVTSTAWVRGLTTYDNPTVVNLGPTPSAGLDPVPDALATFDTIVLTNLDASRLDPDQLNALTAYVRDGGSLVLVGGPNGESLFRSLPAALMPGRPGSTTTVSSLSGLNALGHGRPPPGSDVVSVLKNPRGSVLASQNGVPLVVRSSLGGGHVIYLAFDPSDSPVAGWKGRSRMLTGLVGMANPFALDRGSIYSNGAQPMNPLAMKFGGAGIASELANIPQAALPSILLFLILTVAYILVLGPVNFLVLRRLRRREMMWVTLPLLGVLCVGATFGVAYRLKGSAVFVNAVNVVQLDGSGTTRPVSAYISLFAPVRGDYHLSYAGSGLSTTVPMPWYSNPSGRPVGYRFQEGGDPQVTLPSMSMWTMRNVEVDSSVNVPGSVRSDLTIDGKGYIVGTVHNGTQLPLLHPILFAGQGYQHLADIPAGGTEAVHVKPSEDIRVRYPPSPWYRAFRGSPYMPFYGGCMGMGCGGPVYYGNGPASSIGGFTLGSGPGPCCPGPQPVMRQEKTLADRIRDTAAVIPEPQALVAPSGVTLVGWNTNQLGDVRVDGSKPNRRDLNLFVAPLSVRMPSGPFRLRPGTLGAELMSDNPQPTTQGCCPFAGNLHPVVFGTGGEATFAWTLPAGSGHVRFSRLSIGVNAGGAAGASIGRVYDWSAHRWVPINLQYATAHLTRPDRFVSPSGQILLRLRATNSSGDVRIADPLQSLAISGKGIVA